MGTRKTGFWKADWFLGLAVSIVMLAISNSDLIGSLERKAYDLGVQASKKTPSNNIAIIAIDDYSIANIGRWVWPRDRLARMTDMLTAGQSKLIANTIFFFEPQIDPGYAYVKQLQELFHLQRRFRRPGQAKKSQQRLSVYLAKIHHHTFSHS